MLFENLVKMANITHIERDHRDDHRVFTTNDGKQQDLRSLFLGNTNRKHLAQNIGKDVKLYDIMVKFANDLEISKGESVVGDISESLAYLNQLFLNEYGIEKDETHYVSGSGGKYPKLHLQGRFDFDDPNAWKNLDVQMDQKTFLDSSRFRYNNKIMHWNCAGHRNRHYTQNDGLRNGTFQEKENINRGYDMRTILEGGNNRYSTTPIYFYDRLLQHTDVLQ